MLCFSSACVLVLSLRCVQFSVYLCAILSLCCVSYDVFSSVGYLCPLLSLCCVLVQHVFWCYPYDVFSSVGISVLSFPYAVF